MLFDLRGRGRRRTVQAIYLSLALLMGGGLILFGIGSSQSGGLFDAISGGSGSTSATSAIDKRIKSTIAATRARPRDPAPWAQLAALRFQRASIDGTTADGTFTDAGKARLRLADQAWERHLALDPKQPDVRTAKFMVQAYESTALNELTKAVRAKEIVTAATKPPSSNLYAQLAELAYRAKDNRSADLAATRAVGLAAPKDRKALRTALDGLKAAAAQQQTGSATTTPAG
ncbi:MAG: hypothetical protein QOE11_3565 [Solirubrobacteraceae bacterium]|jgi:hypothetical protein|nr:hypothetical protein [Solirubrobacteraceae bacterium]